MTTEDNSFKMPKDGFGGLRHWQYDFMSAILVFVLSLPFSLSIAFLAGVPITSGIITAVVGGVLVSFFSGSHLTIKMPSLSMAYLTLYAVLTLGSHTATAVQFTFAIIVVAGILQIFFGLFRLSGIFSLIPEAVIYGILATVGIHIFFHQIYFLLGIFPQATSTLGLIIDLPFRVSNLKLEIVVTGVLCVLTIFLFSSFKYRYATLLPAPLLALLMGVFWAYNFNIDYHFGADYFLQGPTNWQEVFTFPDFDRVTNWTSIYLILLIAIFNSLETTLNVRTLDSVDFYRRKSKTNPELIAIGLGNTICGFLGAVPMVSSITHSSTNVNSGGKTRWSGFFHGLLYIGVFFFILDFLHYIPLVALSSILLYQAYTFNSPKLIKDIANIGREQLAIFVATVVSSLIFGLLVGLVLGFISSIVIYLMLGASWKELFKAKVKVVKFSNKRSKVAVRSAAISTNYLSIKKEIEKTEAGSQIYLDFSKSKIVDHNFLELVYHHPYNYNTSEGMIELQGLEDHKSLSRHPLATRKLPKKRKRGRVLNEITRFNERQLDVLAVASINNTKLHHNLTYDGSKLQGFSFTLGYDIKYRENKFYKNFTTDLGSTPTKIEFSDIFLSKGIRMSEQGHYTSVVLIYNIHTHVPSFTLQKEGLFAKMIQSLGYEDIDFEDYPVFSEHYLLKGSNETAIRAFFDDRMLRFLEENQDFDIESSANQILIYKNFDQMTRTEMEDAVAFAENLLKIIYKEEQEHEKVLEMAF